MSRSYKKHGIFVKDSNNKYMKRLASIKVRRYPITQMLPNGKGYKKLMSSWDICDYKWVWTLNDVTEEYNNRNRGHWTAANKFSSLEDYLSYYHKCTRRK